MPRLRVLSWNIRTFGTHPPTVPDLRNIAQLILGSGADIACVQELMTGAVGSRVGDPVSQESRDIIAGLCGALAALDPKAGWRFACSGVDSGISDHMRDAYAFLWKATPKGSTVPGADPVEGIAMMSEPVILRQEPADNFPGRRPGMITALVGTAAGVVPVNIISYHAPTPCNRFSKGTGSGYGINALATLPEIGGGVQKVVGREWVWQDGVTPLPQVDTIVLGDFNYTMDDKWAAFTYQNLLTNYQGCVSTPDDVHPTTYAPSGTEALRLISAYDNVFLLKPHGGLVPALAKASSGVIDFILDQARQLGEAIGFQDAGTGTSAAWYVIHRDLYKRQHAVRGLSDHLPVWVEFTLTGVGSTPRHIVPTSGADNNCLLHAMFGVDNGAGLIVDSQARQRRLTLVTTLQGWQTTGAFPTNAIRDMVLRAMLNDLAGNPAEAAVVQVLLGNTLNPFLSQEFKQLFPRYIANILLDRMLWVEEVPLLATLASLTVVLHYADRGQWYATTINPGQAGTVHIYHAGLHFSRWQP